MMNTNAHSFRVDERMIPWKKKRVYVVYVVQLNVVGWFYMEGGQDVVPVSEYDKGCTTS